MEVKTRFNLGDKVRFVPHQRKLAYDGRIVAINISVNPIEGTQVRYSLRYTNAKNQTVQDTVYEEEL